jgi:Zn-dependent protease
MSATNPGQVRIARILGISVYVHFSWLIIFALITWTLATGYFPTYYPDLPASSYWAKGLVASLLFFVSILLHEMGHALVAVRSGIEIRSITLFIFGGVSQMEKDPDDGATEFRIAVIGPVVSLALAALFYLASSAALLGASGQAVARYLALINLALAIFNLVPAFPLDGGRILRGLLWRSQGKARATRVAAGAGSIFAYFLIVMGAMRLFGGDGIGGIWYVLIGWFLKEGSQGAYQRVRLDETLRGVTVGDAMIVDPETLPAHVSLSEAAHSYFLRSGYGGYPVVRGEQAVGLLCLKDVLRRPPDDRDSTSVQAVMIPLGPEISTHRGEPLGSAMARMAQAGSGRLLVMDGGRLAGLLTMGSVVRHVKVREELSDSA